MTNTDITTRTDIPTTVVECACEHCAEYATRRGLALPLRATVNVKMAAALCTTAEGHHLQVRKAHAPWFRRYDAMQAEFGPWVA